MIKNTNDFRIVPFIKKNSCSLFAFSAIVADHYTMKQEALINQVLKSIGSRGFGDVMEALEWNQDNFQHGFDLANTMQNMDLIKLIYSNFNQNKIVIEFTLLGKARYETLS